MKIWTSEHVFEHPWQTVVHAAWRKYPNPINPAVTGLDVVDRKMGSDGVLRSSRVLSSEWNIPGWVTRSIGLSNPSYAYEYSEVCPAEQKMELKTVNLDCTNFISIDETLVYKPHPEDKQKTLLTQSTAVTVRGIPLVDYMESLVASSFSANSHKGRQAMEWVIGSLSREYKELSQNVLHGMDGLRHGLVDEISHTLPEEQRQ